MTPATTALLERIRKALGRAASAPPPPVPPVPAELVPRLPPPASGTLDLIATFTETARAAGAEILAEAPPGHAVRAVLAIALSGSVVLEPEDHANALASMLADTLIVHLDPRLIVPTVADALRMLTPLASLDGLAANATPATRLIVTGPSKTADIEGILITGVHGPGRVIIMLGKR